MAAQENLDAEQLSRALKALASPVRLRILESLRVPQRATDVRVVTNRAPDEAAARPPPTISRPAVVRHLQQLEKLRLVRRAEDGSYVTDQQGMFAVLHDLGRLAHLRPVLDREGGDTLPGAIRELGPAPEGPRLRLVGGPEEGTVFSLRGMGPWRLGRAVGSEVRLAFDPYVSRDHAVLTRDGSGFSIEPVASSLNPLAVDFKQISPGNRGRVSPGAVVAVGGSRLVFQNG